MNYLRYFAQFSVGLPVLIILCLPLNEVHAAIMSYTLTSNNAYIREKDDIDSGLPLVIETRTSLSGQFSVDTTTGELISATLMLNDYSEHYNWNPFNLPWLESASATLNYTGETQILQGGVFGSINGALISYSGASAWSGASTLGTINCISSTGTLGESVCNSATINSTINPWASFDVDLAFSNDYSMASFNTFWVDSDSLTENTHQLQMLAVANVPVPAAGWFMFSALLSLVTLVRKK